jgi:hypothetical protein
VNDTTLRTIEQEATACRERFAGVPVGAPVWCCHHDQLAELLIEPVEARIDYILASKAPGEQARRLYEFRPVKEELPAEWHKAYAEWAKADAEWAKADGDRDTALAEWAKAYAELDKADGELAKAYAECKPALEALHHNEVPGSAWDGKSIFGGVT